MVGCLFYTKVVITSLSSIHATTSIYQCQTERPHEIMFPSSPSSLGCFVFSQFWLIFILKKKMKRNGGSPYKIHYLEMHGRTWLTLEFSIVCKAGLCTLLCLSALTELCSGHLSTFPGLKGNKTDTKTGLELQADTYMIKPATHCANYTFVAGVRYMDLLIDWRKNSL